MAKKTPVVAPVAAENQKLAEFHVELKALLDKHNVAIEVQSQIIAVDLSKQTPTTTLDAQPTA